MSGLFSWLTGKRDAPAAPPLGPRLSPNTSAEVERWEAEMRKILAEKTMTQGDKVIGVNLGSSRQFQSEVEDIIQSLKGSYAQYKSELEKNKKEKQMNRVMAANFKSNLEVMVDVTNLLHSYMALFQTLRDELSSFNAAIARDKSEPNSLDYLQQLTSDHIKNLQQTFTSQSSFLKDYYSHHPELQDSSAKSQRVDAAARDIQEVVANANAALTQGGAKKKPKPKPSPPKKPKK
jgi:hypothetical protein